MDDIDITTPLRADEVLPVATHRVVVSNQASIITEGTSMMIILNEYDDYHRDSDDYANVDDYDYDRDGERDGCDDDDDDDIYIYQFYFYQLIFFPLLHICR